MNVEPGDDASVVGGLPLLTLLDALPGMVGYWDTELRNVFANAAYRDYFGLTREEIRGRHISFVLGETLYAANRPYLEAALAGERQDFDRQLVDAAGRVRHTQASYLPDVRDGVVRGVSVLVSDVTARVEAQRQLAAARDRYRSLAACMPGGFVLLFDGDLRFQVAEGEALDVFGFRTDQLEGRTLSEALPAPLAEELEGHYRAALAGRRSTWQRQIGDRIFTLTAGPVTADTSTTAGMVVALDTTETHRAEAVRAALQHLATAVARNTPWEEVVVQVAEQVRRLFGVDTAAVVRFTGPDSGEIVAMSPYRPAAVPHRLVFSEVDRSATAQVARTEAAALVQYVPARDGLLAALRAEGLVAGAAAPIRVGDRLWGVVSLADGRPAGVTQAVVDELVSFARLVEIALSNLQAWRTLSEQASTDALTGLLNRRAFEDALHKETARAARDGQCFAVVLLDLDHFKHVNDEHGHLVGDQVLQEAAARLQGVVREADVLARWGGEEFIWLMPESSAEQAVQAAERARQVLADRAIGPVARLTASVGVCASSDVDDPAQVIRGADQALYRAKNAGRNQVARASAGDVR